ncbi:hypothetical protein B0O80DRAFT_466744 [Mortierella sp. GBAus27b]|nr:hypothetical protein BGX31_005389 [Mortierella sp. GBA43]KAI8346804.1 hypothetical protein B0O80DRAFT_466744 [Mortierella sp. GBAus27b]
MFGIPELDNVICYYLDRHDLAQCIRVSKKWHHIVIPYLWHDITRVSYVEQKEAFRRMVLDDYEQKSQQEQGDHGTDHPNQEQPSLFVSTLAKYGPWIRKLPGPGSLLSRLQPPRTQPQQQQQTQPAQDKKEPSAFVLLRHLYRHCTAMLMEDVDLSGEVLESNDMLKVIGESLVPHVRHLLIGSPYRHRRIEAWRLMNLLEQCSSILERLTLFVDVSYTDNKYDNVSEEQPESKAKSWESLKELKLFVYKDISDSNAFLPWLWKRCEHVERLEAYGVSGITQNLADTMVAHMPNLNELYLGWDNQHSKTLTDDEVATILSGSRGGWKALEIRNTVKIGQAAKKALEKHHSTLEELAVYGYDTLMEYDLTQALISSPNLRVLVAVEDEYSLRSRYPLITADKFIDWDPARSLSTPWACEATLRELKVVITGIPRPDLTGEGVIKEKYLGQGPELQGLVYDRLARLMNLETLWLGHNPNIMRNDPEKAKRKDCLELSLESGLHKLAGLKALKELNVWGMRLRMGSKEAQWMVEHWPGLRAIYGLDEWEYDKEAAKWLRARHPELDLRLLL